MAGQIIFDGGLQGRGVVLILNQVGLIVTDVRAIARAGAGDRRGTKTCQRVMDLRAIVGKVERSAARGGVDGSPVCRCQGIAQMAFGGLAGLRQITEIQMDVVKEEGYEAVRRRGRLIGGGRRFQGISGGSSFLRDNPIAGLLYGEVSNFLGLALVEDLEIFLTQVAARHPVWIAHDYGDQHQINFGPERGGRVVRAHLCRIWIGYLCSTQCDKHYPQGEARPVYKSGHSVSPFYSL